ncbi:MAG: ATP-binding protein [Candidatus Sulfopaludibacter sp.]|nr:ATP-binding protein [Candidatus Sulfopaludibacter sp.]
MSIRFRLTAWYFCSLAVILVLFALAAWFAMGSSMIQAVDHDLRMRVEDVQGFIDRELASTPSELVEDFAEQAGLGLGGGLLEVRDEGGRVLYRSARLGTWQPGLSSAAGPAIAYETESGKGPRLRVAAQAVDVRGRRFSIGVAQPLHEFQEARERFEGILLLLAAPSLLLAALGGFWLSGRALAPVDRITNEARRISISNLDTRLQAPPARDELHRLVFTLNEMLARIDSAVKRMVQFTADASHELRAPLTLIHTAAEFSLRRERTREELLGAMRKIMRESDRTARLVDDLLLLARADSGGDESALAPVDLRASARDAVEQAVILAEPKGIRVTAGIPGEPVLVEGDEPALSRLWLILLDNAVKYTNPGGHIHFDLVTVNGHAEGKVTDDGVGIAPHELPHIFDRFWRADKVRSRSLGGAGLGLSIAQWIVERHHGGITVRSEPGKGSQFAARLPLAAGETLTGGAAESQRASRPHSG